MVVGGSQIQFATSSTERFRIGTSGQFGIGGANYGTSGQVLTSQGSGSAPVWSTPSSGGVTSMSAGTAISVSASTGAVTVTNTGVTSLTAGSGITVSASTGAVTVSQDFYTGTSAANVSFPVGSYVLQRTEGASQALAATWTVYVNTADTTSFFRAAGGGRTALTGTWRNRGYVGADGDNSMLMQRTA